MKPIITALLIGTMVALSIPVYADSCGLQDKIARVAQRIDHGIADRKLTRDEVHWLKKQQREFRMLIRKLKSDGSLSRKDCRILAHRIEHLNDSVTRLKHSNHAGH